MRALRLLPFAFLICAACSPDPTGLYENQSGKESFDFRSDKTAKFASFSVRFIPVAGVVTVTGEGKGEWSIRGGKLLFEGESVFSSSASGKVPDITETNDLRVEFSFENNGDLITVLGESYKEGIRFIKQ